MFRKKIKLCRGFYVKFTVSVNSAQQNGDEFCTGAFSLIRDKLNERLRKLLESQPAGGEQKEPKIFNSVREDVNDNYSNYQNGKSCTEEN